MSKIFKTRKNQLTRSSDDRWIKGVFGGIGEYFGWSSNLLRAIWILCFIFFHKVWLLFVLAYIAAFVFLPED